MPNTHHHSLAVMPTGDPKLDAVRAWMDQHARHLIGAALLLGGPAAHRRGLRLLDELRQAQDLTTRHERDLVSLHRLLTLQDVGDPDREETGRFADINPAGPEVHRICLLADSLHDLLRRISHRPERDQPWGEPGEVPRAAA